MSIGIVIPITIEETTNTQSLLLYRNIVWNMKAIIKKIKTIIICAASIPRANSNNGKILLPVSNAVKNEANPIPWINPKKIVTI